MWVFWKKTFLREERAPTKAQSSCLLLIRKPILVGFIGSGLKLPGQLEEREVGAVASSAFGNSN